MIVPFMSVIQVVAAEQTVKIVWYSMVAQGRGQIYSFDEIKVSRIWLETFKSRQACCRV